MKNISLFPIVFSFLFATIINIPGDQPTIQMGISVVQSGDTLLVHPGIYHENITFNTNLNTIGSLFLTTGDSSYISQTVIDGNQDGSCITVMDCEFLNISGFSITNGLSDLGGGIKTTQSNVIIDNCYIYQNASTGIGGGVFSQYCTLQITNSAITNNISTTDGGGILWEFSAVNLNNVLVASNYAGDDGGGVHPDLYSNSTIVNCAVTDNEANDRGDGILISNSATPHLINTIVWGNQPENIHFYVVSTMTIEYSDIEGGINGITGGGNVIGGAGNIELDPQFINPSQGNYYLQEFSPCIDAGNPDPQYNDPDGTRNDIGAFYYNQEIPSITNYSIEFDGLGNYVDLGSTEYPTLTDEFTVETWVKSNSADDRIFLIKLLSDGPAGYGDWWFSTQDNKWTSKTNGGIGSVQSGENIITGQWYHLALTYSQNQLELFVNGISQGVDDSPGVVVGGEYPLWIGKYSDEYFSGNIDELRFWSKILETDEIQYNINHILQGDEDGLEGYWKFNEGAGNTVFDSSVNSNNGLVFGATWGEDVPLFGCTDINAVNFNPNANSNDGSCIYLDDVEPHFSTVWLGLPSNPMGFYIASATLDGTDLRVGDEIAIFDGNYCVGQVQLASEIVPYLQLFASQDNFNTEEIDGFINGDEITYRFWDASEQIEIINVDADVTDGSTTFQSLGYSYANLSVELIPGCIDPTALNYDSEANTQSLI